MGRVGGRRALVRARARISRSRVPLAVAARDQVGHIDSDRSLLHRARVAVGDFPQHLAAQSSRCREPSMRALTNHGGQSEAIVGGLRTLVRRRSNSPISVCASPLSAGTAALISMPLRRRSPAPVRQRGGGVCSVRTPRAPPRGAGRIEGALLPRGRGLRRRGRGGCPSSPHPLHGARGGDGPRCRAAGERVD